MHKQSTLWKEPPGFTRQRLDLDGLLGEAPRWGRFWEHPDLTEVEQAALLRARDQVRSALKAYEERSDNFSLIHADLHPDNIIHNAGDLSLIDFDDSAFGWHMYDIAAMLIEFVTAPDFEILCAALLEGYREHRPLARRDVQILPTFILVRGLATIGWFHQRPEHAGSEYFEEVKNWTLELCADTH
jgi:Ser/Thr protein kinase RdoA (MazF antagonist)